MTDRAVKGDDEVAGWRIGGLGSMLCVPAWVLGDLQADEPASRAGNVCILLRDQHSHQTVN